MLLVGAAGVEPDSSGFLSDGLQSGVLPFTLGPEIIGGERGTRTPSAERRTTCFQLRANLISIQGCLAFLRNPREIFETGLLPEEFTRHDV